MQNFPAGMIALIVVSILIYFGAAHRVLDRMRMNDRTALAVIAAIIIGSFIDIPLGTRITINLGGSIAVVLALYVLLGAGTGYEKIRALVAAAITALALYLAGRFLGAEPEQIFIDPIYMYPLIAGIVGYLAGRSRRGAFFAAVIGVFSLDIWQFIYLMRTGVRGTVHIGGGGAFDSLVLAGILAVLLAELIGESLERIQGGPRTEGRPEELVKNLQAPEPSLKPQTDSGMEAGSKTSGGDYEDGSNTTAHVTTHADGGQITDAGEDDQMNSGDESDTGPMTHWAWGLGGSGGVTDSSEEDSDMNAETFTTPMTNFVSDPASGAIADLAADSVTNPAAERGNENA